MAEDESYEDGSDAGDVDEETGGSSDSFTEVTHQSWGSRLREQATQSIAGFVLFLGVGRVIGLRKFGSK